MIALVVKNRSSSIDGHLAPFDYFLAKFLRTVFHTFQVLFLTSIKILQCIKTALFTASTF